MTMKTDTIRRTKKSCPITEAGIRFVDYKDERLLARFITDNGKILWHAGLSAPLSNGPMTFELDGRQYIVIGAGDTLYCFGLNE